MTTLRLSNTSGVHFNGWLQCNVDVLPPHPQGSTPAGNYLLGNRSGEDTWNLDIYTGIGPGEEKTIDLTTATQMSYDPHAGINPDVRAWGGIPVTVAGIALDYKGAIRNGAAFDGHWAGRITPMLHVDLWVHWYPDDPAWCTAEICICASNPAATDVLQFIPRDMRLVFGDARVLVPGLFLHDSLMSAEDWLADGQARLLSLVLCFPRHGGNPEMCRAVADQQVQCLGLKKLLMDGNPHLPEGFDAKAWTAQMLPGVIEAQHHWRNSPLDPNPRSADTGAQGSQAPGVGGPAMAHPSAVGAFYIAALDASWPMFHLEADGSPLDWKAHPGLRMFNGKVNSRISLDMLGKTNFPTLADGHGHEGPEDEHAFDWCAWAGNRFKGTPGTQWVLRGWAINFLFRYVTVPPGNWLTARRGIGWLSWLAVELYRGLADRELAEAVATRYRELWAALIQPQLADSSFGWVRDDRVGPGMRAVPWQDAVCASGVDAAGFCFGIPEAWNLGAQMGVEILDRGYAKQGDRWASWPIITHDGSDPGPLSLYGVSMGYYDHFGMPLAVATVLKHNPGHWAALEIWAQLKKDSTTWQQASWLLPLPEAS